MGKLKTILLADGDLNNRRLITKKLSSYGYHVIAVSNGEEALFIFGKKNPHLAIIDVMLPKMDGYQVCNKLREISTIPIVLLTALDTLTDRNIGFNLGADDYIVKPFSINELEVRIHSLLRRYYTNDYYSPLFINVGELKLNLLKKCVFKNKELIRLTTIEFKLLEILISKPGKVVTRSDIFGMLWGYTAFRYVDTRVVDVYIYRLRLKLEENPKKPNLILTVREKGYMFQEK
tara:strand:- start:18068 stop:18766 length:699 start_codon:yes stop_codon:yes gene_type:complete